MTIATSICQVDLRPGPGLHVEVPHVAKLVVFIVLASIDVEVTVAVATGVRSSWLRSMNFSRASSDVLAFDVDVRWFES